MAARVISLPEFIGEPQEGVAATEILQNPGI